MKVWVTRSQPGATRQAEDLRAHGHEVLVQPVIDIEPVAGGLPEGAFDSVIFLSEHAVRLGLPVLAEFGWFGAARLLAVGARTAAVLQAAGRRVQNPASGEATSEGLLRLAALQHPGRVLVVAGEGGRQVLEPALAARGAQVRRFDCYRRAPLPVPAGSPVLGCDAVIAASGEALRLVAGFWLAAGGRPDVPVLVPSARVARLGVELGLQSLHDCGGADSHAWLRGLASLGAAGAES